ncbi:hypothetical protein J1N35_007358, partial [Gossypium stocksii]
GIQNDIDLLNPPIELETKKHKLKRLVQILNSFFMTNYKSIAEAKLCITFFLLKFDRASIVMRFD